MSMEHLPDCAALRSTNEACDCQLGYLRWRLDIAHTQLRANEGELGQLRQEVERSHEEIKRLEEALNLPGDLVAENLKLRQENENLKQQVILADAAQNTAMHGAEAFSAEIVKLRQKVERLEKEAHNDAAEIMRLTALKEQLKAEIQEWISMRDGLQKRCLSLEKAIREAPCPKEDEDRFHELMLEPDCGDNCDCWKAALDQ